MPGPGEHQPRVRHHLAIDAADFAMFAVVHVETDAVASADAQVDVGPHRAGDDLRRPEPLHQLLRVGPRRVDFFRRRIETAPEGEAWPRDDAGTVGAWLAAHSYS